MDKNDFKLNYDLNEANDSLVTDVDSSLFPILKDIEKNVRSLEITSQKDYNYSKFSNNTLYFINQISEESIKIKNICDIAVSHTNIETTEPEKVWILNKSGELNNPTINLWVKEIKDAGFTLVKTYNGYIDGRLTFDGEFEYVKNIIKEGNQYVDKVTLITREEPFIVLKNKQNKLYAFPNLKHEPIELTSNVKTFSVERGYCSKVYKENDAGIIIVYNINNDNNLYYIQYGYANKETEDKIFTGSKQIEINGTTFPNVYFISAQRLSDYRFGITISGINNGNYYTYFLSTQQYPMGFSFRPETFTIDNNNKYIGPVIYGAVRNDNKEEFPTIKMARNTSKSEYDNDLVYSFGTTNKDVGEDIIKIELLDETKPLLSSIDSAENLENILDFDIKNSFPYDDYSTPAYSGGIRDTGKINTEGLPIYEKITNEFLCGDPEYGCDAHAKAVLEKIKLVEDKTTGKYYLHIYLAGRRVMTDFSLVPKENNGSIYLRYLTNCFNWEVGDVEADKVRMNGWLAFQGKFDELEINPNPSNIIKQTYSSDKIQENEKFKSYGIFVPEKFKLNTTFTYATYQEPQSPTGFETIGILPNYNFTMNWEITPSQNNYITKQENISLNPIYTSNLSFNTYGGSRINV